ncbi:unnamed protein product [Urochloa humidicola]
MMEKREVARKNAEICKRKASTFSLSSYTCLEENQWESPLNSYLRKKTSDEEVYEEGHHGIADWGQRVVRWREEKACTGTGLVHFGDPEQNAASAVVC